MLIIISPAKLLNFNSSKQTNSFSIPEFLTESEILIEELRKLRMSELKDLLKINAELTHLNFERNLTWHVPFSPDNAKQALLAFNGIVYKGINVKNYSSSDLNYAQNHLRILSGLYGVLRPLDLIQPYRLEMGIQLENPSGKDLYRFWKEIIVKNINNQLLKISANTIINLASAEYFKVLKSKHLEADVITPEFFEYRNGKYKQIVVYTKKARGLMTSFIIKNRIKNPEELKLFDSEGYSYNPDKSEKNRWVFTR